MSRSHTVDDCDATLLAALLELDRHLRRLPCVPRSFQSLVFAYKS